MRCATARGVRQIRGPERGAPCRDGALGSGLRGL